MTTEEMNLYDFMVDAMIATSEELNLARNLISGSWTDVLNSVLYVRTNCRNLEQYFSENNEEEEEDF